MNRWLAAIALFLFVSHACFADESDGSPTAPYRIQPGDELALSVWREEDLSTGGTVLPDGSVSFPLVGSFNAAGKTLAEAKEIIVERLKAYIPDPVVTVAMGSLGGNQIYVIGKVNRPGVFVLNRYLDVMQALSMAGGLNAFAASNKIRILRRINGNLRAIPFRFGDVEKGENLEQNILLQSGDLIVVP